MDSLSLQAVTTGCFSAATNGKPPTEWGAFVAIGEKQIAFGGNDGRIYTRRHDGSAWSSWNKFSHD